jgi:hypothetical protein
VTALNFSNLFVLSNFSLQVNKVVRGVNCSSSPLVDTVLESSRACTLHVTQENDDLKKIFAYLERRMVESIVGEKPQLHGHAAAVVDSLGLVAGPTPAITILSIRYGLDNELQMRLGDNSVPMADWKRSSVLRGVVKDFCSKSTPVDVELPFKEHEFLCWLNFHAGKWEDPDWSCKALDVRALVAAFFSQPARGSKNSFCLCRFMKLFLF